MMWYIKIMEYYSSMKKNKVIPPAVQWVYLEIIILSEVNQTQKDKCHTILLICGVSKKKSTNKPTCKAEVESQMQKTNSGGGGGVN